MELPGSGCAFPLNPADYDNDKPRTIQFVYGETPAGAIMNTITGNVLLQEQT